MDLVVASQETSAGELDKIDEVATRRGFTAGKPMPALVAQADSDVVIKRRREPSTRIHQFSVKLDKETFNYINGEAIRRSVPVAKVIEDMVALSQKNQA